MDLRQLKSFITLSEELNFSRAAARENVVPSSLTQQIQRLERGLGVQLSVRDTHHVQLTRAGQQLVLDARAILAMVDRAGRNAQKAALPTTLLRAGVGDPTMDTMPHLLRALDERFPDLTTHRVEAMCPRQYRMLSDGRLDIGIGRVVAPPEGVESELIRLDPMGLLVSVHDPLAGLDALPVRRLAKQPLAFTPHHVAPEYNEFMLELCRGAGFHATRYPGTVDSVRGAVDLVRRRQCVSLIPQSCDVLADDLVWIPLSEPSTLYPWSLIWWHAHAREEIEKILDCARTLSTSRGWLTPAPGVRRN